MAGKKSVVSIDSPRISNFQVNISSYGRPIPLVFGQNRVPSNMLWYGDFRAVPHTATEESGGKGGGGGVETRTTTYTYTAALILGLCEGPIDGLGWVWRGKDKLLPPALSFSTFTGANAPSAWGYLTTYHPSEALSYENTAYVAADTYNLTSNAEIYNHTFEVRGLLRSGALAGQARPVTADLGANTLGNVAHSFANGAVLNFSTTGVLPYPLTVSTDYRVTNASANAFQVILDFGDAAIDLQATNTGTHFAKKHRGAGVTITANTSNDRLSAANQPFVNTDLVRITTTGVLPPPLVNGVSYYVVNATAGNFQVSYTSGGAAIDLLDTNTGTHTATPMLLDANPKDIIVALLTSPQYGVGFSAGRIDALTSYSNYCLANSLLLSPALLEQRATASVVADICDLTNSRPFFSEGKLKIVPLGDVSATGNGATFTPNTTPIYDFTDDHFIYRSGTAPVRVKRKAPSDAFNMVQVEFNNRANQYNLEISQAKDQSNIELYGLRPKANEKADMVVEKSVADFIAQMRVQRSLYVRNTYQFSVSAKFSLLEPMDLVTLTDSVLGLSIYPVRILEISEGGNGEVLDITAEDYSTGVASPTLYPNQTAGGYSVNYNASPGSVNTPEIFTAPGILTATGFEVWTAISGASTDWGGCEVWVSTDDATYKQAGTIYGRARHGALTANFPVGSDPDTTNTANVTLATSLGSLTASSQDETDKLVTLCLVDDEVIAYSDATLTASYEYGLETYLRRGVFNSAIASHLTGARFVRLDQAVFRYPYDAPFAGQTLYFKLPSFNLYGRGKEDLASVGSYSYVVGPSLSYPSDVTGFSAQQNGQVVVFQWATISQDEPNIKGFEIRYGATTFWEDAFPLTIATRGTNITSAAMPPGLWYVMVKATDNSFNSSRNAAVYQIEVINTLLDIVSSAQAPSWLGVLTGMVKHWTGKLIPDSTVSAANMSNTELFEQFVPYPVTLPTYESTELDIGLDTSARLWVPVGGYFRDDVTGVPSISVQVDYKLSTGSYDGYEAWTIGTVPLRYAKALLTMDTAKGKMVVETMTLKTDAQERTEFRSGIATSNTGVAVTFNATFNKLPLVMFSNDGNTPLIGTSGNVTVTGFTGHLFNTSNTEVGGTGKFTAIGV